MSGLDYTKGCVNFRDVGECVNLIADRDILPTGRILRGGKLEFVDSPEQIGSPGTIINLRKGADPEDKQFNADSWHFPISNEIFLSQMNMRNTTLPIWLSVVGSTRYLRA